jgi:predicted PurR-regulated permease PerM
MKTIPLPFYAKLALSLLAIALTVLFMMLGRTIFIPLVFAFFFAVLLLPLSRLMETKLKMARSLSSFLSVLFLVVCITAFVYFLVSEIINFSQDFPELKRHLSIVFANLQHWISQEFHVTGRQQEEYLNKSTSSILSATANSISEIFISSASFLIWIVFVFFYTFFILYYRRLLLNFVLALFDAKHSKKVVEVVKETRLMVYSYISGLLMEMLIVSIVGCTAFSIMGLKYAILLGVIAAVLNIIPYLGIYSATTLIMLVSFANSSAQQALWAGIVLLIIHFLDANILMPRIVGSRVKMNAFITIIAVIAGNYVWGVSGMFLFIPLTGILKIISERVEGMKPWAVLIGSDEQRNKN